MGLFLQFTDCVSGKMNRPQPVVDSPGRKTDYKILSLTGSNPGSPPIDSPLMLPSGMSISMGCVSYLGRNAGLVTWPYMHVLTLNGAPPGLTPSL